MSALRLLALPGDGIGPEIMDSTLAVLDVVRPIVSRAVDLRRSEIGFRALELHGSTIPDAVVQAALEVDGVLLGPVSHNDYPPCDAGGLNPSGVLRKALELYASIRPARTWKGVDARANGRMDLIVVRENLEGFYADRNMHAGGGEFSPEPGIALSVRKVTERASRRIAERAFSIAAGRSAAKVTAVHKANVMRLTDGLFLETVRDVANSYTGIEYEEVLVDAAAAHLVRDPGRFDVIVTTNMFGDILSDLASELSGGLGLAGSLNVGPGNAAGQAQHGSAPDIAGQDRANPVSLVLSLAMLLRNLGEAPAASRIESAVAECLSSHSTRTRDLGGDLGTAAFTDGLVGRILQLET